MIWYLCHQTEIFSCFFQVKQFILDQIVMLSKEAELAYYEEVKDIYLHPNLFSVDNGLLSKGGNLMRQKLQKYFKPQLEDMYKYLNWEYTVKCCIKCIFIIGTNYFKILALWHLFDGEFLVSSVIEIVSWKLPLLLNIHFAFHQILKPNIAHSFHQSLKYTDTCTHPAQHAALFTRR